MAWGTGQGEDAARSRRLIFSRKGFDSGYGGKPSPILPDGTLVSLPIPEPGGTVRYSQCRTLTGESYLDLLRRLGIARLRDPSQPAGEQWLAVDDDPAVHLDPDLSVAALSRPPDWRPVFGQVGASQTHLSRSGVGPGDIFLFFGWFAPVDEVAGRLRYRGRREQCQVVFGWLEIGSVVSVLTGSVPAWAEQHPHVRDRHLSRYRLHNTLYVASAASSLVPGLAGGGVFSWNPALKLTKPGSTPSVWQLPRCFHPDYTPAGTLTHHALSAWDLNDDHAVLRSARIGQEFVITMTPEIEAWVRDVIAIGA
jgi:hypothetical protein